MSNGEGETKSEREEVAPAEANEEQATLERRRATVSKPGGFKNDPDDPTNPNEAIERSRRTLRP